MSKEEDWSAGTRVQLRSHSIIRVYSRTRRLSTRCAVIDAAMRARGIASETEIDTKPFNVSQAPSSFPQHVRKTYEMRARRLFPS